MKVTPSQEEYLKGEDNNILFHIHKMHLLTFIFGIMLLPKGKFIFCYLHFVPHFFKLQEFSFSVAMLAFINGALSFKLICLHLTLSVAFTCCCTLLTKRKVWPLFFFIHHCPSIQSIFFSPLEKKDIILKLI